MIGDLELCDLCIAQFGTPSTYQAGTCRIHRVDRNGFTILNAEGSRIFVDWVTNLTAGWDADASAVLPLILADMSGFGRLILVGHSKGGADILDLADLLPIRAERLVTFEAPAVDTRAGRLSAYPGIDYAHHGDVVPLLPVGRSRPRPLTWFSAPALPEFPDPFSNHHLATAIRPALVAASAALPA